MKDYNQIAAEATTEYLGRREHEPKSWDELHAIIKSLIEKAREVWLMEQSEHIKTGAVESRAASASEQDSRNYRVGQWVCFGAGGYHEVKTVDDRGYTFDIYIHGHKSGSGYTPHKPAHASEQHRTQCPTCGQIIPLQSELAHASEPQSRGADWMRFRQLANQWKSRANEGAWDSGYVNTWLQCADELDKLITEARAPYASEPPQSRGERGAEQLRLQAAAELLTEAKQRLGDTAFPSLSSRIAKFVAALSQRPNADTSEHNKTCICMYCKPELWPDDNEENKYRDLSAERWNLYHELLMAVENKYEGESRHETALRLIREAQKSDTSTKEEA